MSTAVYPRIRNKGRFTSMLSKASQSKLCRFLLYMGLGALVSGAAIFNQCAPYAVAFVGAAGVGIPGTGALVGAILGYSSFYGFTGSAEYIAACVMTYTTGFVCQYSPIHGNKHFMPVVVTVMIGVTIAFGTISTIRGDLPFILRFLFEVAISGGLTYLYAKVLGFPEGTQSAFRTNDLFQVIVCSSVFLVTVFRFVAVGNVRVGCVLGGLTVMVCGYCGGITYGCGSAAVIGVLFDISTVNGGVFTLLYTLCAVICGIIGWKNRILFGVLFQVCYGIAACLILPMEWTGALLTELLLPFAMFVLLPERMVRKLSYVFPGGTAEGIHVVGDMANPQIRETAKVFSELGKLICRETGQPTEPDLLTVFDGAGEQVCMRCVHQSVCWSNHYLDMLEILQEIAPKVQARGRLETEDFPGYFRSYCADHRLLTREVNHELRRLAEQRRTKLRLNAYSEILSGVFDDFSEVLMQLSQDALHRCNRSEGYETLLRRYLQSNQPGCEVTVMENSQNRLCITISGKHASKLMKREAFVDEVSELLNVRLCASYTEAEDSVVHLYEAEPLAVTMGIASKRKTGECVCGDRFTYFKTDSGTMYVALSDGLGTGEHAQEQSAAVITYLERVLRCGVHPMTALKLLNATMQLNDDDLWGYATVDLVSVDLFTGETWFYKYGAAPSYVLSENELIIVSGERLSAGLLSEESRPDMETRKLSAGDVIVITSDGISIDDVWDLKKSIRQQRREMKSLARTILLRAQESGLAGDDMTVITVRIDVRP